MPTEGDLPDKGPSAAVPPKPTHNDAASPPMTKKPNPFTDTSSININLGPLLEVVPNPVVERLRGARRVPAMAAREPGADTLGATLAVTAIGADACGGGADPVCTDPVPRSCTELLAGIERFRADPDPDTDYDLLVI